MSSTGMTTSTIIGFEMPASTIDTSRGTPGARPAAEEAGDLGERPLRGRQPDALRRLVRDLLQPLERHREVGAALGGGEGVDLVDDDGLDVDERLGRIRREHQVEALRRRDEQVGRAAQQRLAVLRRRVARAHRHLGHEERTPFLTVGVDSRRFLPQPLVGQRDARQRRAQVLLDVERQRPQRRDVEDAGALLAFLRRRRGDEAVDRRQERGQRLAAAGRRADQRVLAGRDVRPTLDLRLRRLGEGRAEPRPHGGREPSEDRMISDTAQGTQRVSQAVFSPAWTSRSPLCDTAPRDFPLDIAPPAVDSETQRVHDAVDALIAEHDPTTTDNVEFRGARYDAGLAWVHFPVGSGGLGVRPDLNKLVERLLREAGAAPTEPHTFFMNLAAPTIVTHGSDEREAAVPPADVHRRGGVVPAVLRARRRLGLRRSRHPRGARRRRVDRQRPEGVEHARPPRRLRDARHADRS